MKYILTIFFFFIYFSSFSQDKQKEIGVTMTGFDDNRNPIYGFVYRQGTENHLWKVNILGGNINLIQSTSEESEISRNSYTFNLNLGYEWRKNINSFLEFRYGLDLLYSYDYNKVDSKKFIFEENDKNTIHEETEEKTSGYGMNLVLGVNYVFKSNIVVGIEISPGIVYNIETRYRRETDPRNEDQNYYPRSGIGNYEMNYTAELWRFNFNNYSTKLSIIYRL